MNPLELLRQCPLKIRALVAQFDARYKWRKCGFWRQLSGDRGEPVQAALSRRRYSYSDGICLYVRESRRSYVQPVVKLFAPNGTEYMHLYLTDDNEIDMCRFVLFVHHKLCGCIYIQICPATMTYSEYKRVTNKYEKITNLFVTSYAYNAKLSCLAASS